MMLSYRLFFGDNRTVLAILSINGKISGDVHIIHLKSDAPPERMLLGN
jgi:hypothetical protein